MAALASEFPGALREADELPMAELEQRVHDLHAAQRDATAAADWMTTMARFHALTRGALSAKRWLAGRREVTDGVRRAFLADVGGLSHPKDARGWSDELEQLASPSRGRVTEVVFARLSAELGREVAELRMTVFSRGRRRH